MWSRISGSARWRSFQRCTPAMRPHAGHKALYTCTSCSNAPRFVIPNGYNSFAEVLAIESILSALCAFMVQTRIGAQGTVRSSHWGSVCPGRALRATFIVTFPDSVPKFTITQ